MKMSKTQSDIDRAYRARQQAQGIVRKTVYGSNRN
jgi:hypothetical protein